MALYYDLHIHSCLSPCADDDMTPANICAMARLKGLGLIAVTDHQSAGNLPAAERCARREGLMLLPGLEVCTREEAHLLAYFESVDSALEMGAYCARHLPPMKNRPELFGRQLLVDERENLLGEEPGMLIAALDEPLGKVCEQIRALGGVPVPAHVNRGSNGMLGALGLIPPEEGFRTLEIAPHLPLPIDASGYRQLHSSDAHRLGDIAEAGPALQGIDSLPALLCWLRGN